eukprot:363682-Chlamydomonas_euryale.AAC.14
MNQASICPGPQSISNAHSQHPLLLETPQSHIPGGCSSRGPWAGIIGNYVGGPTTAPDASLK